MLMSDADFDAVTRRTDEQSHEANRGPDITSGREDVMTVTYIIFGHIDHDHRWRPDSA